MKVCKPLSEVRATSADKGSEKCSISIPKAFLFLFSFWKRIMEKVMSDIQPDHSKPDFNGISKFM